MIDTKLVLRLIETARSVMPLVEVRAAALEPERQPSKADAPLRAQVAARLPDGTFRVVIDGKALKLALPPEVKTGDVLQLRMLPRPSEPTPAAPLDKPTSGALSNAGQVVARVLAQPGAEPPRQTAPILPAPTSRPEELSEPLARAVERSGVFYESHQARWVEGDYPLPRLLEEPQASLGRHEAQPEPNDSAPHGMPLAAKEAPVPVRPLDTPQPSLAFARLDTADPEPPPPSAAGTASANPVNDVEAGPERIPAEALPLVRQQLDTLETRQLLWLGDIWPGQAMRWEIREQPQSHREDAELRTWHSRFELRLPSLGGVDAELVLAGTRLGIRLSAQHATTAAAMRSAAAELTQALEGAGLQIASCQVRCDESAL